MKLLLTKTEIERDYDNNRTDIHLFGRDVENSRHHRIVRGMEPHFYVPTADVEGNEQEYLGVDGVVGFDHETDRTVFGEKAALSKVTVDSPNNWDGAKELFETTFAGDMNLAEVLRIENGVYVWIDVPDREVISPAEVLAIDEPEEGPELRIVTLDIEVDDRGSFPEAGEKRITSIVAHDSYDDEYIGFIDGDQRDLSAMFPDGKPEEVDLLHVDRNEKEMLIRFASWVSEKDSDCLTGWNFDNFDAPYIVARMEKVGANPSRLSPLGDAFVKYNGDASIGGLTIYDLLDAYKKNSASELRSYSLDYVAGEELGASKLEHEEGYFEMFETNPTKLINYNARDVRLTTGINEKAGVIGFRDTLRKQVGVDLDQTRNNYQFVEMMARRKLYERGELAPTGDFGGGEEDYDGGFVFDPHYGVARNVVGIDVESLYPWTMYMLNASPDTKIDEERARREGIPFSKAPNGVCFRLDREGLFKSLVKDAIALKEDYRTLRDDAEPESDEEAYWAKKYNVAKTITNSIYGVIGWVNFFLYDRETAEAVTLAGQAVIKNTADFVPEASAAEVIYGDTDSNYISFPSNWEQERCVREAMALCDRLEDEVYPLLAEGMGIDPEDCEWRIGPEMFAPRFLQWGKKKKYAYLATWKEGMDDPAAVIEYPKAKVAGAASKRSDSSRLTRDTEKKLIDAILSGRNDELNGIIYSAAKKIDPDDPAWDEIGIPGGIGKALDEYETPTAQVRAAKNANALCGTDFGEGSKPMRCYIQKTYFDALGDETDVIGYVDAEGLDPIRDQLTINAGLMVEKLLVNPLGEMLDAVGVDVDAAVSGQNQTGLGAFL